VNLFSKNKKKENSCCCGDMSGLIEKDTQDISLKREEDTGYSCEEGCCDTVTVNDKAGLVIKILGSGCKNCITLADNVKKVLEELQLKADIIKVTDFAEITSYGVMSTPALVVNEKVVSYGKVLKPEEILKILNQISK
jgi:small redox-active disulfide protein 2